MRPIRKAVIPVAGTGTRVLPATKAVPKEMLPIVDKPLVQYAVEEALAAGIEQVVLVTGRGKAAIEDHFDRGPELAELLAAGGKTAELAAVESAVIEPGHIAYIRQHEPLGLGHAVWCARHLVGEAPFAVLLPDELILARRPCLAQMLEAHATVGGNLVAVTDIPRGATHCFGMLDVTFDDGRLAAARGVVEKPAPEAAPSTLAVVGRCVLQPAVMRALGRLGFGAGGEIRLIDALVAVIDRVALHGLRFEGRRFDCGSKAGFLEAQIACSLAHGELAETTVDLVRRYAAEAEIG